MTFPHRNELPISPPKPAKISTSLFKKRKNNKRSKEGSVNAEHVEMIDKILSTHEREKSQPAASTSNASGYHGIGTRQQSLETSTEANQGFDPNSLFEQTYIRKAQADKVKRLLEKKKKKEEREQRKAVKRSQKYAGIGNVKLLSI